MAVLTTVEATEVKVGGHPAMPPQVGMIQRKFKLDPAVSGGAKLTNGGTFEALSFEGPVVVLAAGVEVITAPTNATAKVALGPAAGATCMAATALGATDGANLGGILGPIFIDAEDTLDITGSVADADDGEIRVWALVADISDMEG